MEKQRSSNVIKWPDRDFSSSVGFRERSGGAAIHALAVLRGVRNTVGEQLSLTATIDAAIEEGAKFKRWSENPSSIERIQVWVEGQLVISLNPDGTSTALKSFRFEMPKPESSVMQVVITDSEEETVILLNLALSTVSSSAIDQAWELPNGQHMRLVIARRDQNWLDVLIALVPEKAAEELEGVGQSRITTKDKKFLARGVFQNGGFWPYLFTRPRWGGIAIACLSVILTVGISGLRSPLGEYASRSLNRSPMVSMTKSPAVSSEPLEATAITSTVTPSRYEADKKRRNPQQIRSTEQTFILETYDTVRGGSKASSIHIRNVGQSEGGVRFILKLPVDSQPGVYRISVVNPYFEILSQTKALSADGKTLRVTLDKKLFRSGKISLKVSSGEQVPFYYSLNVDPR
jgi:hypothetical protein